MSEPMITRLQPGKARGAKFSPCMKFRYSLWDYWWYETSDYQSVATSIALYIMLNPSTADEMKNDPTIERCSRRAKALGHGGIEIVNLFALRSTDPIALYTDPSPVGHYNDAVIDHAVARAHTIICAWGNHGAHLERSKRVREIIKASGRPAHHLGLTKAGEPRHPLYVGYDVPLQEMEL